MQVTFLSTLVTKANQSHFILKGRMATLSAALSCLFLSCQNINTGTVVLSPETRGCYMTQAALRLVQNRDQSLYSSIRKNLSIHQTLNEPSATKGGTTDRRGPSTCMLLMGPASSGGGKQTQVSFTSRKWLVAGA